MRINLVTALLVITATIALLLLVPLSVTSQSIASNITVSDADATFDSSMSINPSLETAIRVVSATGADSMLNLSLDISPLQARPAIGPSARIQVQGADDVQSLGLANPFVVEDTSTETPVQTSTPVPTPTDTPLPIVTDTQPSPTNVPLPSPTETPIPTVADTPLPDKEQTKTNENNNPDLIVLVAPYFTAILGCSSVIIVAIITYIIPPLILDYLQRRRQETNSQGSPHGEREREGQDQGQS